jgi:alkylation response protein AidB-like acyl-CoA dehydrogenase
MTAYTPPLADMRFALTLAGFESDITDAVLEEAAKLASEVIAPTNRDGDKFGAKLDATGNVTTAPGFKAAYQALQGAGWCGAPFDPAYGGQGLPWVLCFALQEMWATANMAFSLCPLLTQGAVEVLATHGTDAQKKLYLEKLATGEYTGSMQLTEPQAGSDVGALRLKAVRKDDHYLLSGQKIYITYGDHDFTDNILHMVLGRVEGAPAGIKGISLFACPKVLPDGTRNDVKAISLEHKMGIHGSPTAVMSYGDKGGAVAYLIGEENRGIDYMFIMMNAARLGVGLQGLAIAERALQQARLYARERIQSRDLRKPKEGPVAIINHPDVRRMLLTIRAYSEAMRALAYEAGAALDKKSARADLLTPIVKAWSTDLGVECASLGVQIHGGMGYIEETGAAQLYRDAKIACIYEGTNGIQANDLVFRKVQKDGGKMAADFIAEGRAALATLAQHKGEDAAVIVREVSIGLDALEQATHWLISADSVEAASAASPYLKLFGQVAGGVMMARSAALALIRLGEAGADHAFCEAKLVTARFYAEQLLPPALALAENLGQMSKTVMALDVETL